MRVRLVLHYNGLSIGAVRDVFEKSLGLRLQKMNPNTDYHCLKTFGSYFNEDIPIPAGTKIDFCQTSDGQLITEIDGRQIGAVKSKDLCSKCILVTPKLIQIYFITSHFLNIFHPLHLDHCP
jgi:hypothetical protein